MSSPLTAARESPVPATARESPVPAAARESPVPAAARESPVLATARESPHRAVKTQHSQKQHVKVKSAQSCLTLCDPIQSREFSRPRILEWVAYPFSRGSSQPRDQTQVSRMEGRFFTS